MTIDCPMWLVDVEQQRDQSARARHLRQQVEQRHGQVDVAAATRTGRCFSRKLSTSAIVNLPVLRSNSATSSRATSQATRKPIE